MTTRCSTCVLPESYPGIRFDEAGVCSLCRAHAPREYSGLDALRDLILRSRHADDRRPGGYDCVMAFSGGRDSTYMLHLLVDELHLHPIAYFLDNGLVPPGTYENVRRTTDLLGVRLVVESHGKLKACLGSHLRAFLRRPSPAMVGLLCTGCRLALTEGVASFARKLGASVVVYGSTPFDASDFKLDLLRRSADRGGPGELLLGYLREVVANPRWIMNPRCLWTQGREFHRCFWHASRTRSPGLLPLSPLDFAVRWVEEEVVEVIQARLGWRKHPGIGSTWRGDCKMAPLKGYIYRRMLGFNDDDVLLSYLVRDGQLDRPTALDRLSRVTECEDDVIDAVLVDYGYQADDLRRALARAAEGPTA